LIEACVVCISDEVKDEEDDKDKLSEKKVTFIDEGTKTTPKSSKIKKGNI
jgi:hypothetical protein